LNKKTLKMYWEIGATSPFFYPKIRRTTTVGCLQAVMKIVDKFLGVVFPIPYL
jgi:hypothetical protein